MSYLQPLKSVSRRYRLASLFYTNLANSDLLSLAYGKYSFQNHQLCFRETISM